MIIMPEKLMCEMGKNPNKFLVASYLIFKTTYNNERKQYECDFSYISTLKFFENKYDGITKKKLQTIMKQLIAEGYFEVVRKGTSKNNPTILKNLIYKQYEE